MAESLPVGATWNATTVFDARGAPLGPVSKYDIPDWGAMSAPTNDWTWGDVKRQNARNAQEVGAVGAAGALASLAQVGLGAINTSAETRDAATLARLTDAEKAGKLGLSADERAQAEATILNPARAAATEATERTANRLAAAPTSSLATQAAFAAANDKVARDANVKAGIAINQANIEAKQRQEAQIESMMTDKANREAANIDRISGAVGDLAKMGGKIAAAQVQQRGLSDKEIGFATKATDANGKPLYPSIYGKKPDDARALMDQEKVYVVDEMRQKAKTAAQEEAERQRKLKRQGALGPVEEPAPIPTDYTATGAY